MFQIMGYDCIKFASRRCGEDVAMRSLLNVSMELVFVKFFCIICKKGIGNDATYNEVLKLVIYEGRQNNLNYFLNQHTKIDPFRKTFLIYFQQ